MSAGNESWKAQETTNFAGSDRKITVTGTVQTSNGSQNPELVEAESPGINNKILLLDLKIHSGTGATVMGEQKVEFVKRVEPNQYGQVTIRRDGGEDVTTDVEVIHS